MPTKELIRRSWLYKIFHPFKKPEYKDVAYAFVVPDLHGTGRTVFLSQRDYDLIKDELNKEVKDETV